MSDVDYMRRCDIQRMIAAELLINHAMEAVERLGADVRLTDAVSLLQAAKYRVADYVDRIDGIHTVPLQSKV